MRDRWIRKSIWYTATCILVITITYSCSYYEAIQRTHYFNTENTEQDIIIKHFCRSTISLPTDSLKVLFGEVSIEDDYVMLRLSTQSIEAFYHYMDSVFLDIEEINSVYSNEKSRVYSRDKGSGIWAFRPSGSSESNEIVALYYGY